jgi:hypothetical protein
LQIVKSKKGVFYETGTWRYMYRTDRFIKKPITFATGERGIYDAPRPGGNPLHAHGVVVAENIFG